MKLSASNIAWTKEQDEFMYRQLQIRGYTGLEIAPTRWFQGNPYDRIDDAVDYSKTLKKLYGISVSSMQSIWYGCTERIAGTKEDRKNLLNYTKRALTFAGAIGCHNLVFGCPRNRVTDTPNQEDIVIEFLEVVGRLAENYDAVVSLEANPVIYGTNFANTTSDAIRIIKQIGSPGLRLNLDFGTIIENDEGIDSINRNIELIHHVHISEPLLMPVKSRKRHKTLKKILKDLNYEGYISLEMRESSNEILLSTLDYLSEVFG